MPRWEIQHSAAYGKPFEMLYYAKTKEECDKWWAEYGSQFSSGATQTVEAPDPAEAPA